MSGSGYSGVPARDLTVPIFGFVVAFVCVGLIAIVVAISHPTSAARQYDALAARVDLAAICGRTYLYRDPRNGRLVTFAGFHVEYFPEGATPQSVCLAPEVR